MNSKDLDQSAGCPLTSKVDSPTTQKKQRRKKPKSTTSSPKATSRQSRTSGSKGMQTLEV
uniref:Uncharacterized protein n=1 Tax=Kalanchoe fedtschenkoi TaxID=63787 RepID=A0A7N0UMJ2_KALFE